MMEVHLNHDKLMKNYIIALINSETNRGWYVWNSRDNVFQSDWDDFEYYFEHLEVSKAGWTIDDEVVTGQCIYRGTDVKEAKQAAIRYMEYL